MDDTRQTLTLAEAADILGVSAATLRRAAREDALPFPTVQIRGRRLVSRKILNQYINGTAS